MEPTATIMMNTPISFSSVSAMNQWLNVFSFYFTFLLSELVQNPQSGEFKELRSDFWYRNSCQRLLSFLRAEQTGTFVHMRPETSDKWTFHTPALAEYANYSRFYQAFPFSSGS